MSPPLLEVNQITKRFVSKKQEIMAVNNVSFEISSNEIVGLVGHNGSGKTTILKMLAGLLHPDEGIIKIEGELWKEKQVKETVAILLEGSRSFYWNLTGRQNLAYFSVLADVKHAKPRIAELIELLGMSAFVDRMTGTYSRGMQQKLSLAIVLLQQPKLLILDEPSNGLDYEWSQLLAELLQDLTAKVNMSIIVVSHDFHFLYQFVDRILHLKQGKLVRELPVYRTNIQSRDQYVSFHLQGELPANIDIPVSLLVQQKKNGWIVNGNPDSTEVYHFISLAVSNGLTVEQVTTSFAAIGKEEAYG
ncbi:ABC transporter ATP-binding protein [Gracilibacillus lacisalsi]|uniref:ABC transporter ATP-binding protein n=1 Tax=Gracilibacillus lacisalsi TaxID=393087 RepID=UPI00037E7E2F|nr:ABC transporter ATP-binding protein [Gracilibacillus lacisalsi]